MNRAPVVGGPSPWGTIQHLDPVGDGIVFAATASHGGYFVPAALLDRIPAAERAYARSWSGSESWYEEDCACLAVVLAFPDLFPPARPKLATYRAMLDKYMTDYGTRAARQAFTDYERNRTLDRVTS